MMNARRIIMLLCAVLLLSGCMAQKFKQINVTSFGVESISPKGLRNFDAVVSLGLDNPAPSFNILNFEASISRDSVELARVKAENVAVEGKTSRVYRIPVSGVLTDRYSLIELAFMSRTLKPEDLNVDISAKATIAGVGKNLVYKDIPLVSLMGTGK